MKFHFRIVIEKTESKYIDTNISEIETFVMGFVNYDMDHMNFAEFADEVCHNMSSSDFEGHVGKLEVSKLYQIVGVIEVIDTTSYVDGYAEYDYDAIVLEAEKMELTEKEISDLNELNKILYE